MKRYLPYIVTATVCIFILALPYVVFRGNLFIGGDDTRLFYLYPYEFLTRIAFFSWNSFSSYGFHNPNQYFVPFVLLWYPVKLLITNQVVLDYLAFSLPLFIAFVSMNIFLRYILGGQGNNIPSFLGSLLYIFSPITQLHQISVSLVTIWFFAVVPLLGYLFLRYLREGTFLNIFFASLVGIVFSLGFYAVPWIAGLLLPLGIGGFAIFPFLSGKSKLLIRACRFVLFVCASQAFWLVPFFASALGNQQSFADTALSSEVANTFASTVSVTASGNVLYPFLNLPQRQLAFDFNWDIKYIFETFYDRLFILSVWYGVVFFTGLYSYRKSKISSSRYLYSGAVVAYLAALFFLTVNIGPLRDVFLSLGVLPGFSMFRNFYDKFALGTVFLSSVVLAFSLFRIYLFIPKLWRFAAGITFFVLAVHIIPIRSVVDSPVWGTKLSRTTTLPHEYTEFLSQISGIISPASNVLVLPFNIASYAVIPSDDKGHVYVGTSPTKIISSVNSISGGFSFFGKDAGAIRDLISQRRYEELRQFLAVHNIGYVMVQKNIPNEVLTSYLYDREVLPFQDEQLIQNIVGDLLLTSSEGNYKLYKTQVPTGLFELDNGTVEYTRMHPGFFYVTVNASSSSILHFRDSFHNGWNLYPSNRANCSTSIQTKQGVNECLLQTRWDVKDELSMLFTSPIASEMQSQDEGFGNTWELDATRQTFKVYFEPQRYFYIGIFISLGVLFIELLILAKFHSRKI